MCVPCALIALAADGPSFTKLLDDARRQDRGCDCATHAAAAAPKGPAMPACPACRAIAVTLAKDPNFVAIARRYPSLRMGLCADCRSKSKVFGDDASDAYYSTASDPQYTNPSVGPLGPLPPSASGPLAGNSGLTTQQQQEAYYSTASDPQFVTPPSAESSFYSSASDSAAAITKAIALAQSLGKGAQYGVTAPVAAAYAPSPAAVQSQSQKKTDKTWEIALGVGVALIVLYFVTREPKPAKAQSQRGAPAPGPNWSSQ